MLLHFLRTARPRHADARARVLSDAARGEGRRGRPWLLEAMIEAGSLEHGRTLAREYSERALGAHGPPATSSQKNGDHRQFLRAMLRYVIERAKYQ